MSVKTERITILGTPSFKAFLAREAEEAGVSISELVRSRCEGRSDNDEIVLAELIQQMGSSTRAAKKSLQKGIAEAQAVLNELNKK